MCSKSHSLSLSILWKQKYSELSGKLENKSRAAGRQQQTCHWSGLFPSCPCFFFLLPSSSSYVLFLHFTLPISAKAVSCKERGDKKKRGRKRNIAVLSSLLEIHQLQAMHAKFLWGGGADAASAPSAKGHWIPFCHPSIHPSIYQWTMKDGW